VSEINIEPEKSEVKEEQFIAEIIPRAVTSQIIPIKLTP
jgi:hypothetical protein